MKLRVTIETVYESNIDGDDFDKACKDIYADIDGFVQKATRTDQSADMIEEVSERVAAA